jgi:hypothetical protein
MLGSDPFPIFVAAGQQRSNEPTLEVQRKELGTATNARYTPEVTTWVKIKNRQYSQAVGREDSFDRRKV